MIPPFQELMLPILEMYATRDPESIANREFMETLAKRFHLTEADRNEMLSSGRQLRFENRVYWALAYLRRAGLIESAGRGLNRITKRGHDVLKPVPFSNRYKAVEPVSRVPRISRLKATPITKRHEPLRGANVTSGTNGSCVQRIKGNLDFRTAH